jgi:hypothetical protein
LSHCHSEISWHITVRDLAFDGVVGSLVGSVVGSFVGSFVVLMSTSGTRRLLSSVPDPDGHGPSPEILELAAGLKQYQGLSADCGEERRE